MRGNGQGGVGMVDGVTQLVGVMGWPVTHSLSPVMHNAALQALGLNWIYVPLPVRPAAIDAAVRGATALGFRGFNVTVPHKQAVLSLVHTVATEAAAVGAVNTVVIDRDADGEVALVGHNTDVAGFLSSLRAGGFDPAADGKAVVVGAGGAARAVVYGLAIAGMREVVVLNRTPNRAEALVSQLADVVPGNVALTPGALTDSALGSQTDDASLLVHATTLGMWPKVDGSVWPAALAFPPHLTVYDLVYNPLETRLLRRARASGARPIDGLGMLARQGAIALNHWTDASLDVAATATEMRRVCEAALAQHA